MNESISQKCIDLIKHFEGCRLKAYKDATGILTIGYGHIRGVKSSQVITQSEAELLLKQDLQIYIDGVNKLLKVDVTQNQFDALVSFSYNCGLGNLRSSTLLRYTNLKRWTDASKEFLKWDKAGGKVLAGLTRRRKAESNMYLGGK